MSEQDYVRFGELKIFMHQIYEFKKGVRNLVLCTMCPTCAALVAERLRGQRIEYLIQEVTDNKVNLYFGKRACLDAVRAFIDKPLNRLTPEQDFMLGAMSVTISSSSANAFAGSGAGSPYDRRRRRAGLRVSGEKRYLYAECSHPSKDSCHVQTQSI